MTTEYSYAALNLAGVLLIIIALMYILNRLKMGKFNTGNIVRIIQTVPVGTKEKLILIDINNTKILIGSTPNHIETLYVYNEIEAETEPTLKYSTLDDKTYSETAYSVNNKVDS